MQGGKRKVQGYRTSLFILFVVVFLIISIHSSVSFSAPEKQPVSSEEKVEFNPLSRVPVTLASLVIVCILAVFILRFFGAKGILNNFRKGQLIKILEKQSIGPRHMLLLVEAGGKYLLIGMTDKGFTTISEIDEKKINLNLEEGTEKAPFCKKTVRGEAIEKVEF